VAGFRSGSCMPWMIAQASEQRKNDDTQEKAPRERALARGQWGAEFTGEETRRLAGTYISLGPSDVAPVTFRMGRAVPR
jgi:hypothetical protein